ncbi:MAG: hypothetical protein ABIY63_12370, partial [Fibrobacteria bacterium]
HDSDDTLVKPPHHDSDDTLVKPPHHDGDDSMPKPPLPRPDGDTLKEPPHSGPADDTCALLHAKLEIVKPGEAGRADLEHAFAAICKEPLPKPPVVTPPSAVNCDELRKKLTALDPASPDAVRLKVTLEGHCPEVPAAK